ncbi:MAG: PadR family transcriptional regulator [Nitrososphaeria archaeon]|jgi:DNA-binding PadR family transcriptional regulator
MVRERALVKGMISLLILDELLAGDAYGYQLMKRISEVLGERLPAGYIYVVLRHLEKKRCVKSRVSQLGGRRIRMYFITERGKRLLVEHLDVLRRVSSIAERIATDVERKLMQRNGAQA